MFKALKESSKYRGASHADDLFYLFTTVYHEPPISGSKEGETIKKIVGIFTSFAIEGDPNCQEIAPVKIIAQNGNSPLKCVNITENGVAEILLPEEENLKVWNSIYEAHNVPLY